MYEAESRTSRPKQEGPAGQAVPPLASAAEDEKKTKKQLLEELQSLRQRIRDLEAFESERKAIATELKGTRQRLQYLLAVSPGDYLHHEGVWRLRLHLCQRQSPGNHGLHAAGDDHRSKGLAGPPPSRRRPKSVWRDGPADRPRRRHRRISLPP